MARLGSPEELEAFRQDVSANRDPTTPCIAVCAGTGCLGCGAGEVIAAFQAALEEQGLKARVTIKGTGCPGFCERGSVVVIYPEEICYLQVTPDDVPEIVSTTIKEKKVVDRLLYVDPATGERAVRESDIPFYRQQQRLLLSSNIKLDSKSIDDYLALGGYSALAKALSRMTAEEVLQEVKKSNVRGRGGGGFPAGRKWEGSRDAPGDVRYVLVNADEGDPGAFMDRALLEGNPHSILEGLIIGAYAIGAHEGYVYVRQEYPLAVENVTLAITQAEAHGLLGENILGSGFDFVVKVHKGAGAFVCGESTALMTALEGRAGEPRPKYTRSNVKGLWQKPTVLNNVETWANVPLIINRGADWYTQIGTEGSKGTKIFSLVGKITNTGLVEVPMGITLRDIVYKIGGGIPGGKKFKAVQTGGPSGGCIPEDLLDLEVGFDELTKAGSMMGSGGMIVMDEDTCMVDVARYFIGFLSDESCGKCVPCREGLRQLHKVLSNICEGKGKEGDIQALEELSEVVEEASLCALGTSAPAPMLSTLRYFHEEYEEHIKYKRCRAAVCKNIISSACQHACPLDLDVPVYVSLIAKGRPAEAAEIIRKKNPLPSICGRVCHRPCETKCTAGQFGDPVPINDLKRFALDYERDSGDSAPAEPSKKPDLEKVAIVGSGPAGLTAAHDLALLGYRVTIFEALPVAGGMLAVGIPEYRLPRDVLDYDVGKILELGVELKTNTPVDGELGLLDLKEEGYEAVLLAVGLHKSKPLPIDGIDSEGVLLGVEFLKDVALGNPVTVGKRVTVIGGGDVAIDCARSALRVGAEEVHMAFLEPRDAMLAHPWDIAEALDEGVVFHQDRGPKRVVAKNGRVSGLEILECLSIFDKEGRFNPVLKPETEEIIESDTIIVSIGQLSDLPFLESADHRSIVGANGLIGGDRETLTTDLPGVFVAGDVCTGPGTVSGAMAGGRVAAESIHRFLRGIPLEREYEVTRPLRREEPLELSEEELDEIAELGRASPPELLLEERTLDCSEVRGCFSEDVAIQQAKRCLRCDLKVLEGEDGTRAEGS